MHDKTKQLDFLLQLLRDTENEEIDCDEFWSKASALAEVDLTLPLQELRKYLRHMKICQACKEELELLKEIQQVDH